MPSFSSPFSIGWLYTLLLTLLPLWAPAAPAPTLAAGGDAYHMRVARGVHYYEDSTGQLTFAQAQELARQQRFQVFTGDSLQFGYHPGAYWIRFYVRNALPPSEHASQRFYVAVRYPLLDSVSLYANGRSLQLGDNRSFYQRLFRLNDFIFPLDVPAGQSSEIFLRVQSSSSLSIPLHVYTERSYIEQQHGLSLGDGIYFGISIGLCVYNLILFLNVRRRSYAVYVIFVLVHMIFNATMMGHTFRFWPQALAFQQAAIYMLSMASAMCLVWFGRVFLEMRRQQPRLDLLVRIYLLLGFIVLPLLHLMPAESAAKLNVLMMLVGVLLLTIASVRSLSRGYRPASYYLVGQGAVLFSVLFTVLTSQNILPYYYLAPEVLKWCSVFELLFFSMGLADLMSEERRMRERAQQESHAAQHRLLEMQIKLNEDLDLKVRERTEELEQANVKLQALNTTDDLTQLRNRRYFNEALIKEYQLAFRKKSPLSLLMLDIDHFKQLNDRHGHQFGDLCLVEAGRIIRQAIRRPSDVAARYGGEEFVIILHDTSLEGARRVAEGLLVAFRHALVVDREHSVTMTVSIGIAAHVPAERDAHEQLIKDADAALYRAKDQGRNRVEWHGTA